MKQYRQSQKRGFTLIEMVVAIVASGIIILGIGAFLSNGQSNYKTLFSRVFSDSAIDGFAVQQVFDSVCRKASMRKATISDDADTLELYYWNSDTIDSTPECYARFYLSNEDLYIEHGTLKSGTWDPDSRTAYIKVASDIESLKFDVKGASVQMYMTYQDQEAIPVVCSSMRHNY